MKTLKDLSIHQPYIALFGSGNSVLDLPAEDLERIRREAFVVTLNYAPIRLPGHLNMWSDRRVSEFLEKHYRQHDKDRLLLVRERRATPGLRPIVDFWFNQSKENLRGNYTIVWALQLLQKYFPEKTILLFGVDMNAPDQNSAKWYDRYTDFDRRRRGKNYDVQTKLNQCADQLRRYCSRERVINCNPHSRLDCFPKADWRSLFSFNILHLCMTPLAGAPVHLSQIINKYTSCRSRTVLRAPLRGAGSRNLQWDYDLVSPGPQQLRAQIEWADIIHFHRKIYPADIKGKPSVLQFHSPPAGYQPGRTHAEFNGRKLVIAQYHPRYYTDALIVPNMIDIWDPVFQPGPKSREVIKIFYSWATEVRGGWGDKGSEQTQRILSRIKATFGRRVDIKVLHNRPYRECMAEKRNAHICIDECVTGSYHLQSLEGCAAGALTFNNLDEQTLRFMRAVNGEPSHPFEKTNLEGLYEKLHHYIENPELLVRRGQAARRWMEQHWDPRQLVGRYLEAYSNLLHYGWVEVKNGVAPQAAKSSSPEKKPVRTKAGKKPEPRRPVASRSSAAKMPAAKRAAGRSISELYRQYDGADIYIFGGGPSLFSVDPEAYRDKLCFGINFAFEVMPHIDYTFIHVLETYEALREVWPRERMILPKTLVRQWYREREKNRKPHRLPVEDKEVLVYPIQNPYERNIDKKQLNLDRDTSFFTWSTTTHSAIHAAAYMGARNIYLIGVDYRLFPNGKVHFDSRHSPLYGAQNWNANSKHRQGDEWLKRQLKQRNINLVNLSTQPARKNKRSKSSVMNE